jgi:hypothetical protein
LRQRGSSSMSEIIKIGDHRFSTDGQELAFLRDKNGEVEYLHIQAHAFKRIRP